MAVGLVAKTTTNKVPLWVMVLAAYSNDVLKLGFKAIGLEHNGSYIGDIKQVYILSNPANIPWSHGLFMSVVWSAVAAAIAYLIYRNRHAAGIVGLVVFSHWVLDVIVHPPELPLLFNGSPMVGLGLWTSGLGLIIASSLEVFMLVVGLTIYLILRKRKKVEVGK